MFHLTEHSSSSDWFVTEEWVLLLSTKQPYLWFSSVYKKQRLLKNTFMERESTKQEYWNNFIIAKWTSRGIVFHLMD